MKNHLDLESVMLKVLSSQVDEAALDVLLNIETTNLNSDICFESVRCLEDNNEIVNSSSRLQLAKYFSGNLLLSE